MKAERLADSLQRAKDHVSSAVLDALHREKSKSFRLENVIKEIGTNKGDDVINSRASTLSHAGHSSDTRTVYHLHEEKEIRVAHSRSSMPGAVDRAVPMLAGLNQSTSSSNSSEQCSSRTEHTTPNRFNSSASSGTEPSPLPPPLPLPTPLGGSQRGEGEIDDYRSSSAPYFSQSCPSHAVSSIAIPATCATRDQDTKPVARRELRLDAMSFDSPSRTVVDGLTRSVVIPINCIENICFSIMPTLPRNAFSLTVTSYSLDKIYSLPLISVTITDSGITCVKSKKGRPLHCINHGQYPCHSP